MKIILFGAAGLLGDAVARAATGEHELIAFTRADLNICDRAAINDAVGSNAPNVVINCAAYTAVDAAETDQETAHRINAEAPGIISETCAHRGCRFIHVSSDYVFNGQAMHPYTANAQTDPLNVYGRSKRAGEIAALAHGNPLIVRASWLYGAQAGNFLTRMLALMTEKDKLSVVNDQIGAPTHVDSLAMAIIKLACAGANGIHHFTDSGTASWFDFATAIEAKARAMGLINGCEIIAITSQEYQTAAERPRFSVLDCNSTWEITGKPRAWDEELDRALQIWETMQ